MICFYACFYYIVLAFKLCPKEGAKHSEIGGILTVELSKVLCYHINLFLAF